MKIVCNADRTQYRAKPEPEQIRKIQCNLEKPMEIEVQDLFRLICSGCSFRPAAINGSCDSGFIEQSLFAVDVDNSKDKKPIAQGERLTPEQAIERARTAGLIPNFVYRTFSDSAELPKFRILFLMDKPVKDLELRKRISDYIISLFGTAADPKCGNAARLFFGSNKPPIWTDANNINCLSDIERLLPAKQDTTKKKKQGRKRGTLYHAPQTAGKISNIELIKAGNYEELRKRLGNDKPIVFDNSEQFLRYVYSEIDIAELLEISTPKSFCCIFHSDTHPSASIFIDRFGNQRYKCHSDSCGVNMNVKQVIESLMDSDSEYKAFEFIKRVYNLQIKETLWSREQISNIESIINCLTSTAGNGFSEICPTAAKTTKNATLVYLQVLNIARTSIFPDMMGNAEHKGIIFPMSIRQLARATGKSSIDKVSKYLKMLIYHKMLEIVPDEEIPTTQLRKANAKRTGEKHCHTNFYSIPSWVFKKTREIEQQGQKWKQNNYRLNGISYELFLRAEGVQVAQWLYPQTATFTTKTGEVKQRTTTKTADNRVLELSKIALNQIEAAGYTTEAAIIQEAGKVLHGYKMADVQLKRCVNEILDTYSLKKIRTNNETKAKYNIESKGFPFIIVKE